MTEQARTITLDGVSYDVATFSEGVQQAVTIYNTFNADLQKAQLDVVKCQAAMQSVGNQITAAVKKELEAAATAANEATVDAAPADAAPAV
jgi:hypothetical protein